MLPLLPMNQKILIYPQDSYDNWGKPIQSEPYEVAGHYRYNSTRETVVGNNGDEVVFTANIYVAPKTKVDYDAKVGFIDEFGQDISKKPIRLQMKRDIWGTPMMLRVVI